MSSQQGRKIAMVGATGTVGTPTLAALLKTGIHTITAITRTESDAVFPSGVEVKRGDYNDDSFLVSALKGHDVLILQLGHQQMELQVNLIEAAAKAGVPWVLPTEFGSDIHSPMATEFPQIGSKKKYRDLIEAKGLHWIGIVNDPWFDWSLRAGLWHIDIPSKKATLVNVGDTKFNTSTLSQVGSAVAKLLSLPEDKLKAYENRPFYVSSFLVSQREIFDSVLRATGTKESDWEVKKQDPEEIIQASRQAVAAGNFMAFVGEFYTAHMQEGRGGNYEEKAVKDAAVIGLEKEDLDEAVKRVVADLSGN